MKEIDGHKIHFVNGTSAVTEAKRFRRSGQFIFFLDSSDSVVLAVSAATLLYIEEI